MVGVRKLGGEVTGERRKVKKRRTQVSMYKSRSIFQRKRFGRRLNEIQNLMKNLERDH